MTDRDEWGDRDRPADTPAGPPARPQARRVAGTEAERWGDEEPTNAAPPRKGGGWVIPVVIASILLVGAVGAAIYLVVDGQAPPAPRFGGFGPPAFGPGGFGPPPGGLNPAAPDWQPADEGTDREIRTAVRNLGRALQKPDYDPDDHFDLAEIASRAIDELPRQARWGQAVHEQLDGPPGGPGAGPPGGIIAPAIDPPTVLRSMLRANRPLWRKWDWDKAEVRAVMQRTDIGPADAARAMVWIPRLDGPPVKWVWTFARAAGNPAGPGGFGGPGEPGGPPAAGPAEDGPAAWKVREWEDATCGLRGTDELAIDLIGRAERRWDHYAFRQLADLHRRIDEGEFEGAEERLSQLARTRPVGRFADLYDVADVRLKLQRGDTVGAAALLNALRDRETPMVGELPLVCEAHLRHGHPATAETDCRLYLKLYGRNPDVQALLAEALAETNPPEAREHVAAALKEQPEHPRALNVLRKLPDGNDEFARRVTGSPRFIELYRRLMPELLEDGDWKSLRPLAEEYHARRPDDSDAVRLVIQARSRDGDTDSATDLYLRYAPQVQGFERVELVGALAAGVGTTEQRKGLYARLPDDHLNAFFGHFARDLMPGGHANPNPDADEPGRELTALMELHATRRPNAPVLRAIQAEFLIRKKKWAEAEAKLAGIDAESDPAADYLSARWEVADLRGNISFALKKWDAAVAGKHGARVFHNLAERCESEKKWADLLALVAAAKKAGTTLPPAVADYWSGVALTGEGKHAAAAAAFEKALAAAPSRKLRDDPDDDERYDGPLPRSEVVGGYARELIKVGKAADAVVLLEKEDVVPPVLFAHALTAAGKPERAAKYLTGAVEGQQYLLGTVYRDPDFGPVLNDKPEFAEFRARYPKPDDPVNDPD